MPIFKTLPILAAASTASTFERSAAPGIAATAEDAGSVAIREPGLGRQAFQAFYDRTSAPLRRYLLRVCGDPAEADDVLQESYVRLINRSGLEAGPELRSYLFRTATHLLRDRWRRRARERRGLLEFFASLPGRAARPASIQALDLESALAELAPRDRALLWLAYVEGYVHRDIAAMLGLATGSVKVKLFRLRKRLAERLAPTPGGRS